MYYVLFLLAVFFSIVVILFYKITSLKMQLKFLNQNYDDLLSDNKFWQQEKITYIQKIEQLSSKLEHQILLNHESDKIKQEFLTTAKSSLFDLGGKLSKELIEIHKRETLEAREVSEKNMEISAKKFSAEFEKISSVVNTIFHEVEQSKNMVDIIKQSLLSPSSIGSLAEITLENILKSSGLKIDLDFIMQYHLTTTENAKLRPDAVVFLPSDNLIVIDAKASKFLFDDPEGKNLAKAMNNHLKILTTKDYAENILLSLHNKAIDFNKITTLMFLPTEQAVEKIINIDSKFLEKTWNNNIFLVGPTGLMNMLSFAKFQISDYRRVENHKLILEEVRKLIKHLSYIAKHSHSLGKNINSLVNNYDEFAASFNKNLLSSSRNLQKFGIDSDRTIHPLER